MEQILMDYYSNNAKKLHGMVDKLLLGFGGISNKDWDDFYSLANEVFVDVIKRHNSGQSFDAFLYLCLSNKMKTEMTRRNCYKRKAEQMTVPIDMPFGDNEKSTLAEHLASDIDIEKEVLEENLSRTDERIERYLSSLSKIQRKIVEMKINNVEVFVIKKKLNLTDKQYLEHMRQVKQYEHIRLLHI